MYESIRIMQLKSEAITFRAQLAECKRERDELIKLVENTCIDHAQEGEPVRYGSYREYIGNFFPPKVLPNIPKLEDRLAECERERDMWNKRAFALEERLNRLCDGVGGIVRFLEKEVTDYRKYLYITGAEEAFFVTVENECEDLRTLLREARGQGSTTPPPPPLSSSPEK